VIYRTVIRPILFRMDAEASHEASLAVLRAAGPIMSRLGPMRGNVR
jgi:hypothetical protein